MGELGNVWGLAEKGERGQEGAEGKEGKPAPVGVPAAAVEREAGKEFEPSATAVTAVYLSVKLKAEKSAWEVLVDGKPIYTDASDTLAVGDLDQNYGFRVKAKGKWELKMNEGVAAEVHSVYQEG